MKQNLSGLLAPISSSNPCGPSARYEPEYEAIDLEITKLTSIDRLPVDWLHISRNAKNLLSKKSKDLQVSAYLALAQFELNSCDGLIEGLELISGLQKAYWAELHPSPNRMRARIQSVEWLKEQILKRTILLDRIDDYDALNSILVLFNEILIQFTSNTDGKLLPEIEDFRECISDRIQKLKESEGVESVRVIMKGPSDQATPFEILSDKDVAAAGKSVRLSLGEVASYYRKSELSNPLAFRYTRLAAWSGIVRLPSMADGRSGILPISKDVKQRIDTLIARESYAAAITYIETRLIASPFQLDLHRYVVEILASLGEKYFPCIEAVKQELAGFLSRFPDVLYLRYSDGTNVANDKTIAWIDAEIFPSKDKPERVSCDPILSPWMNAIKEARELAAKGKFNEGLAIFDKGIDDAFGKREDAWWRYCCAQYCMEYGYIQVAIAQLEKLNASLTNSKLTAWDPALSREITVSLMHAYNTLIEKRQANQAGLKNRIIDQFEHLAVIDVELAIRLSKLKGLKAIIQKKYDNK